RTLIGLDERGVVVALHLEDRGLAVTDVDHARVLTGPADDPRPRGGEPPEPLPRRLVGAMLAPHHREDAELREVRRAPHDGDRALELRGREPMLLNYFRRNIGGRHHPHPPTASQRVPPSPVSR